jgi:hypothetical protein
MLHLKKVLHVVTLDLSTHTTSEGLFNLSQRSPKYWYDLNDKLKHITARPFKSHERIVILEISR